MLDGSVAGVQIKVTPSPKSATCWEPWATNCTTGIISQSRRFWVLYPYPFKVPSACCSTVNRTRVRPSLSDWSCSSVYRLLSPKLDGHSNATTPTNAPAATPVVAPDATAPAAHKPPQDTPLAVAVATPPNRSVPSEAGRVPLIFLRGMFPCASVSRPPSKANSPYWLIRSVGMYPPALWSITPSGRLQLLAKTHPREATSSCFLIEFLRASASRSFLHSPPVFCPKLPVLPLSPRHVACCHLSHYIPGYSGRDF